MCDVLTKWLKLQVVSASLFVKKVKVSLGVQLGHIEALLMANTEYHIDHVGMKVFSILAGSCITNQEKFIHGTAS